MSSLPRSQRVEAVVLRHSDWGEADRMLTIFTRELGKLRVVAKGARRPRSRKAGHLEPFTRVALLLARGREIWIVTQAETLDAYLPVRDDLERTGYAAYVAELLDRFTYEEGENSSLYRLFVEALERVSTLEDPVPAIRYYEIRLLDLLGFRPELFHCVQCGNEIQPEAQYFSALLGGVVCPRCGLDAAGVRPVSMQALKYLRHYQRCGYAEATRVRLPDAVRPELEALMQHYLTYLLERGLNSPAFLREVRRKYTGD